jgi:acetoin utilization deacetylase AcuC-like enzyme
MMPAFIYSDGYYADIGNHVFPIAKYRLVYQKLRDRGIKGENFVEPQPASKADLLLVHDETYVEDLLEAQLTERTVPSELPISEEIVQAFLLATGGTIRACEEAVQRGCAANLAGGFHHAFPGYAEGFCYINDMAVAIRCLQRQKREMKAAVIDCDLHQGNGTVSIFRDDKSVFTFSIHQRDLYPPKQVGDWDIHLRNGTGDEEYLGHLEEAVPAILEKCHPGKVRARSCPLSGRRRSL